VPPAPFPPARNARRAGCAATSRSSPAIPSRIPPIIFPRHRGLSRTTTRRQANTALICFLLFVEFLVANAFFLVYLLSWLKIKYMNFGKSEQLINIINDISAVYKVKFLPEGLIGPEPISSLFKLQETIENFVNQDKTDALSRLVTHLGLQKPEDLIHFASGSLRTKIISALKLMADSDDEAYCIFVEMSLEDTVSGMKCESLESREQFEALKQRQSQEDLQLRKKLVEYTFKDPKSGRKPPPRFHKTIFSEGMRFLKQENIETNRIGAGLVLLAANSCYVPAYLQAGFLQERGDYATISYVHAYKWYALAHEFDKFQDDARRKLSDFQRDHPADIAEGQNEIASFKEKNDFTISGLLASRHSKK
jgi:hypothetical protein